MFVGGWIRDQRRRGGADLLPSSVARAREPPPDGAPLVGLTSAYVGEPVTALPSAFTTGSPVPLTDAADVRAGRRASSDGCSARAEVGRRLRSGGFQHGPPKARRTSSSSTANSTVATYSGSGSAWPSFRTAARAGCRGAPSVIGRFSKLDQWRLLFVCARGQVLKRDRGAAKRFRVPGDPREIEARLLDHCRAEQGLERLDVIGLVRADHVRLAGQRAGRQ